MVGDASIARFEEADPREMLDGAVHRLQRGSSPMVLVLQDGRLVGLLTAENVAEFVMVRTALTQGPGSASVGR